MHWRDRASSTVQLWEWDPFVLFSRTSIDLTVPDSSHWESTSPDYRAVSVTVTPMLTAQNLLYLQERRKHLSHVFLLKVVEGSVQAIPPENYLTPQQPKLDHVTAGYRQQQMFWGTSIEERIIQTFFLHENH